MLTRAGILAFSFSCASGTAIAGDSVTDMFSYGGFGTAAVARSDTNQGEFVIGNQMAGATEHFLKVQPLPDLAICCGKMELPTFLVSDSRNLGYASTWLRAPDPVYGEALFDTYEGGDLTYKHAFGSYMLSGSALLGAPNPATRVKPTISYGT